MDAKELIKLISEDAEISEEQAEYALTSFCVNVGKGPDESVDVTDLFEGQDE